MPDSGKNLKLEPHHWWLIIAMLAAVVGVFILVRPYINALMIAFILSILCHPVHQRIEQWLGNKPNTAALLSVTLLTVVILMPLVSIIGILVQQAGGFFSTAYDWFNQGKAEELLNHALVKKVLATVNQFYPFENIDSNFVIEHLGGVISRVGSGAFNFSTAMVGNVTSTIVSSFLMLFVLFFLLRDYDAIVDKIRHIMPLTRTQEDRLLDEVESISKSAILGSFLTALAQGVAGGFAMWLVGFPGLFWGMVMGFSSFIPVVGTMLVWVPAAIYLFLTGEWQWALFLMIWGALVVGSIDNFLRPFIMQGNSGMNTLLIFFSLIGGINVFGLLGLIYGPLIFALALALFNLYENEFDSFLERQDRS